VTELHIREDDWLADKDLRHCGLREEGVTVLGIYRSNGDYVGVPQPDTAIEVDDTLILYGRSTTLHELDTRRSNADGDAAHERSTEEQQREIADQDRRERQSEGDGGGA
jgi:K+/H+ antiporter YhaU regulatory subunit KhtT